MKSEKIKPFKKLKPKHYCILRILLQDHMNTLSELLLVQKLTGGTALDYLDEMAGLELTLLELEGTFSW